MRKIHHHMYHLPGVTDFAKQKADAEFRRDKRGETTILHDHQHFTIEQNTPRGSMCNERCLIYIPGEATRPVTLSEARQ